MVNDNIDVAILPPLNDGRCPDCAGRTWRDGPRGGMSQNVECRKCGSRFNIARYQDKVVFAERIGNDSDWDVLGYE